MNLIVVVDNKWGIGKNGGLLFSLKKDMKFFRETTDGKIVVMGANTFLSLPHGALPNRVNIVLDSAGTIHPNTVSVSDVETLNKVLQNYPDDEIFIIGGASFYRLMLPRCQTAFVTKVEANGDADVFFPDLDSLPDWTCVRESEPTEDNGYIVRFCTYKHV